LTAARKLYVAEAFPLLMALAWLLAPPSVPRSVML
jgi:hypothetical protein